MVRVKMMRGNETAIFDDGKFYTFDIGGRCVSEDSDYSVSKMDGACDLPIISVLSSNGTMDLGVVFPGQDKVRRYKTDMDLMTCIGTLQLARGFIKMLRRNGTQQGVRFNQLLFVYREDYDIVSLLKQLRATEV